MNDFILVTVRILGLIVVVAGAITVCAWLLYKTSETTRNRFLWKAPLRKLGPWRAVRFRFGMYMVRPYLESRFRHLVEQQQALDEPWAGGTLGAAIRARKDEILGMFNGVHLPDPTEEDSK